MRCEHQIGSARDAIRDTLRLPRSKRPTALITINDLSAIGAMRTAAEPKLSIRRDLPAVGFDNIPLDEFLPVALTTVSQPITDMIGRTAGLLIKHILGKAPAKHSQSVFETRLVIRESTAEALNR